MAGFGVLGDLTEPAPDSQESPASSWDVQPVVLRRYETLNGVPYQVDDSVAPQFQKLFQTLHDQGYRPESVQGPADRNVRDTNTLSKHSPRYPGGVRAVDIDPDKHPEGVAGTWGPIDIRRAAADAGLVSLADRRGRRGPDEMHVEANGVSRGGGQQPGGATKMAGIGELVDPNTGEVMNAEQQV